MNARRTSQIASAVVILGAALLAGTWGYNQTLQPNQTDSTEISPAPIYPAGYSPVKIDHPPQRQEKALKQAAATANKTPDPLSQVWEFNAQQPPELLAQPLTEPNWYITGVVQQGDNTRVMVQFQGENQVRFYKIGDVLPGGSKLAWVKPEPLAWSHPNTKISKFPSWRQRGTPQAPLAKPQPPAPHLADQRPTIRHS